MRQVVFAVQNMPPAAAARFSAGVTWFGQSLPITAEIGITCLLAVAFLALAITGLGQAE